MQAVMWIWLTRRMKMMKREREWLVMPERQVTATGASHGCSLYLLLSFCMEEMQHMNRYLLSVRYYHGGQKIHLIPPISQIPSETLTTVFSIPSTIS